MDTGNKTATNEDGVKEGMLSIPEQNIVLGKAETVD